MPSPSENALAVALKELIGNLYVMYIRAHGAHWNVEGPLFPMLHDYFGDLQSDVFGSIDTFAESLRQHEFYAPNNLSQVIAGATIADASFKTGQPTPIMQDMVGVNAQVMTSLNKVFRAAETASDLGLSNFVQDRLAAHLKHSWQLRAYLKDFSVD
jgi:starvation-inducible DNA-binding protein